MDKFEHYFGVRIKWRDVDGNNVTFAPEFELADRADRILLGLSLARLPILN